MKFASARPFTDPEIAARKLIEIASTIEPVQDGRIYIEQLNGPVLFSHQGSPAELFVFLVGRFRAVNAPRLSREPSKQSAGRAHQTTRPSQRRGELLLWATASTTLSGL